MSIPMPGDQEAIRPATLQGQIIVGALVAGLVTFLVIATVIDIGPKPAPAAAGGAGARGRSRPNRLCRSSPMSRSRLARSCCPCRSSCRVS